MDFNFLRNSYIDLIKTIDISAINPKKNVVVRSPLRVNLSAGWNDTPPYCNEVDGSVLNCPILFNNNFPINVSIKKIDENAIILRNLDTFSLLKINNISELLNCQSPSVSFALHKSCLLASGLIPFDLNFNLNSLFNNIGGFELSTSVKDIPIGSGLGTSSILIFSCIKAIYNYCNLEISNLELFHMTTCAEQIMTTGGGYQDQIGCYCKGIKFTLFSPGIYPTINCENLILNSDFKKTLQNKLAFIYTGDTRVAKDLLQKIMENYVNNNLNTISTLHDIGIVSKNMRDALINSDLTSFANNMTKSFELNVNLNSSFTNNNINNILNFLFPFIDGYMLSGAGNGGFLTVILKDDVTKFDIDCILNSKFPNSNIKLYNFTLYI